MSKRILATYLYSDECGVVQHETVRYSDGTFKQRQPDRKGRWIWNLNGVRRVPYRLLELLARKTNEVVFVVEGEKDVESLVALGFCATTNAQGAGWEWPASWSAFFGNAFRVVLLTDCDGAGRAAAAQRGRTISIACNDVRLIDLSADRDDGFDVSDWLAQGHTRDELLALVDCAPCIEPPAPVTIGSVLDEIKAFILRFVMLASSEAAVYLTLWVFHTHAIDAADHTPFTIITSPQKRSGKSRLLEVLKCLVSRPWMTSRTTVAAFVRKINQDHCTLLLDETDAAFGGEKDHSEALRAVLDAAHTRGATATLCVGQGAAIEARDFEMFTAVAIAGIGRLPETITDRGVRIGMKRKIKGESIERFRPRKVRAQADSVCARTAQAAQGCLGALATAEPELPDELNDRAQDGWEPLLAIADEAGGDWPKLAREAAKKLSGDRVADADDDQNISGWLLRDIRKAFNATPRDADRTPMWEPPWPEADRLHTAELIDRLSRLLGSPWSTWRHGNVISATSIAKLLDGYTDAEGKSIRSKQIKIDGVNRNGYERADFGDAFLRFLPADKEQNSTDSTAHMPYDVFAHFKNSTDEPVESSDNAESADRVRTVDPVELRNGAGEDECDDAWDGPVVTQTNAGRMSTYNRVERLLRDEKPAQQSLDL